MAGAAVAGGEALAGDDEGGGVGAEVEEQLGENVKGEQSALGEGVIGEADDGEDDSYDEEAADLDGFATQRVDQGDREPIARDAASADEDKVSDGIIAEDLIHVVPARKADSAKDGDVIQAQAVVGEIKEEPDIRVSIILIHHDFCTYQLAEVAKMTLKFFHCEKYT